MSILGVRAGRVCNHPFGPSISLTDTHQDAMSFNECQRVSWHMDEQISVRLESDVVEALKKAAQAEDRTLAQEVRRLIIRHLQDKGYLPKPKK